MRIASPFDCGIRNCHVDDLHESFLAFASFCLTRYALRGECRETINVKPPARESQEITGLNMGIPRTTKVMCEVRRRH